MSINDCMQKIKLFLESDIGKDILMVLIIVFVGIGSFGLGRISTPTPKTGLKIDFRAMEDDIKVSKIANEANVIKSLNSVSTDSNTKTESSSGNFFASNRGTKYYGISCSAGKTIKTENRIYFDTREEAERAGYELSSACR